MTDGQNSPPDPTDAEPTAPKHSATGSPRGWLVAAVVVIVMLVIALVAVLVADDDDDDVATVSTTSSTTAAPSATSTSEASTTTAATDAPSPPADGVTDQEASTVVWPDPASGIGFDDAEAAARSFAEDLIGFESPTLGEYQAGDSRSGEIEITAFDDGPVTTAFVRQMSDDHWYVLGAVTQSIELDEPVAGTAIDDPVRIAGRGRAFEGVIQVRIHDRANGVVVGEGSVMGGGAGELEPFAEMISWEDPDDRWGVVVLKTLSARDGEVMEAVAVPVGFIGFD